MEKIKINLTSGSVLEKPLVTAFSCNDGTYVVFDNEINGTMGLPIILVSKLDNNKLTIVGETEWNAVKETLRMIIAGNQVNYVAVAPTYAADDVFFKQLTLPVASFDALKANYKPADDTSVASAATPAPSLDPTPAAEPASTAPTVEPVAQPAPVEPAPVAPEVPTPAPEPVTPAAPVSMPEAPSAVEVPSEPVAPTMPVEPAPVPATPVEAPSVEPIPEVEEPEVDIAAEKEAFLKACENMFDALVAKLKK